MADRIQHRYDTAARWSQINPVLLEGEIGYVSDNPNQHKIGDGVHAWNDLPLRGFTGTITQGKGSDENAVMSQKAVTDLLNEGYLYVGIATPTTNPSTPKGKVFYLASEAGTYTNFGGLSVADGEVAVLKYNGSAWSKDTTGSASKKYVEDNYGSYTENEEFIRAYTDAEGKFLWGIRRDGTIEWAKGVPSPIQKALNELENKINDNDSDVPSDIDGKINGLQSAIDVINASLKPLSDTFSIITNEEYAHAIIDNDGRILFGITTDGKIYIPKQSTYDIIKNSEWLSAWVDASDKVLFGVKADGSFYAAKYNFDNSDQIKEINDALSSLTNIFNTSDSPEFLDVKTDSEGKILESTDLGGKKYFAKQELLEKYNDVEGRTEMTLDTEGHILSYRDSEGVKHESKLDVKDLRHSGKSIDIDNLASKSDLEDVKVDASEINVSELNGVIDYSKENLLILSEFTESFNDGENTFSPPAENIALGYRLSNPIKCKAGEWFTRNGTITALIVNTDESDKNGEKLLNPGASFQAKKDGYIRVTALNDGSITLNSGKYVVPEDDRKNAVGIPTMKLSISNFTKDTRYIQAPNGKYYELIVDNSGNLSTREIDPDVIPDFDIPTDMPSLDITKLDNNVDFSSYGFDRCCIAAAEYLIDLKATGITNYFNIGSPNYNSNYNNFEHFYNSLGQERYGMLLAGNEVGVNAGLIIFDKLFNVVDYLSTDYYDYHDFIYIDDGHYITFGPLGKQNVEFNTGIVAVSGYRIFEYKGELMKSKKLIGSFDLNQDSVLKDVIPNATNIFDSSAHMNTITFDGNEDGVDDTHIIVNLRNCDSFYRLSRNYNELSNTVKFALEERVGGRHNSENYDIPERIKTDDLCQWFHCHDVKFWGVKNIGGVNYPTYTLYDNNWKTSYNPRNNGTNTGVENTNSRIVQLSVDWENKVIKDYKVYIVDNSEKYTNYYSNAMGGATMLSEGVIFACFVGHIGLFDFTGIETTENITNQKVGAKHVWEMNLSNNKQMYRSNIYKLKK